MALILLKSNFTSTHDPDCFIMIPAPIAIGGVGGSGTRIVAAILQEAGIYIGNDLNGALDNLWFTLLFKNRDIRHLSDAGFSQRAFLFLAAMTGGGGATPEDIALINELAASERIQHSSPWLKIRAESLVASLNCAVTDRPWGWKEPNTHIVIDRLARVVDGLKYIHVARNGMDMAFSQNQNQPELWGPQVLGENCAITPRNSLRFWCWAHQRILRIAGNMKPNFLFLKFEDICADPEAGVRQILTFAGIEPDEQLSSRATALVTPPKSIGRHKSRPLDIFAPEDVLYVKQLGFAVGE